MKILIICLVVIGVLLIGIITFQRRGNRALSVRTFPPSPSQIQFEMLPTTQQINDTRLVEINDEKVISHFTNLVPESLKVLANLNSVKQYKDIVKAGGDIYQAIIPKGAVLDKSRTMKGAFRGSYRTAGEIKGNTNLVSVNSTTGKMARVNVTNAVMGVGSMVVGQYYMEQINSELKEISNGITRVTDFQDNEYRSKVFALVIQVQKIAQFQVEVFENEELRMRELSNLDNREQECIQLLGQANLTIDGFSKKQNLNFEQYEKELTECQKWIVYQNTLSNVLSKISDLKHTLNLGSVSREKCNALLLVYSKQVQDTQDRLKEWHSTQMDNIGIDIDRNRRKRVKFDRIIYKLPGLINEDYNFKIVSEKTADMISNQINNNEISQKKKKFDLFQKDVKVIVKEGKLYYLPEDSLITS